MVAVSNKMEDYPDEIKELIDKTVSQVAETCDGRNITFYDTTRLGKDLFLHTLSSDPMVKKFMGHIEEVESETLEKVIRKSAQGYFKTPVIASAPPSKEDIISKASLGHTVEKIFDQFEMKGNYCPVECFRQLLLNGVTWSISSPYKQAGLTKESLESAPNPRLIGNESDDFAIDTAKRQLLKILETPEGAEALEEIFDENPDLRERFLGTAVNLQFSIELDGPT